MAKGKLILLLFIPILIIGSWQFFKSDQMISIIIFNQKWKEYPEYYAYDTSMYLSLSILSFIIWKQSKLLYTTDVIKCTKFCFILTIIRLADYWLFHNLFEATSYILISLVMIMLYLTESDLWLIKKINGKIIPLFKTSIDNLFKRTSDPNR